MECAKCLNDLLTEKQVLNILNEDSEMYHLDDYNISRASQGLSGFLGEHYRIKLYVKKGDLSKEINLFVKIVPRANKPKANFIDEHKYFARESLMFKLIAEIAAADNENPWCAKAYIYNKNIMVMPDLSVDGYSVRPLAEYLDLDHVLVTVRSLARFHAAVANNFTRKSQNEGQYRALLEDIKDAREEPTFKETPWLRAAAKLTVNFLKEFGTIPIEFNEKFDDNVYNVYLQACNDIREYADTLNVLLHKDLWINNVMFKYEDNVPTNAILIDYQCIRYGPPAFDLMIFLYLTTSKIFRGEHEAKIIDYYFSVFTEHVDNATKLRMMTLNYDLESLKVMCEAARRFGMVEAMAISPFILMDPDMAQTTFDDPKTYNKYMNVDRSEPVVAHARRCAYYRDRQLEIAEEFVERYVISDRDGKGHEL